MNAVRIFVPRDATACALGADRVAAAIVEGAAGRGIEIELLRNGKTIQRFFPEDLIASSLKLPGRAQCRWVVLRSDPLCGIELPVRTCFGWRRGLRVDRFVWWSGWSGLSAWPRGGDSLRSCSVDVRPRHSSVTRKSSF